MPGNLRDVGIEPNTQVGTLLPDLFNELLACHVNKVSAERWFLRG
jgi:hypothetical protein